MKRTAIAKAFVAIVFIMLAGCATMETLGHKYVMKGQILDVSSNEVTLCIGSADGAKTGQEFPVYRYTKQNIGGKSAPPSYKRETVGSVMITQVVDEHYARAVIIKGDMKVNDVAELAQ